MALLESFDDALAATASKRSTTSPPALRVVGGNLCSTAIEWHSVQSNLTPHSHGLVSSVYRCSLSPCATWPFDHAASSSTQADSTLCRAASSADGLPGWVCIKRVEPDTQPRPHSVSREVALLSSLSHPNVAPLLAAILDESDPFGSVIDLVLPLYAATLEEVLAEPSLVPSLTVLSDTGEQVRAAKSIAHLWSDSVSSFIKDVSKQLLNGVAFLHVNAIAHRDIKPSNILLSHNGVVKIIDLATAYTTRRLRDPISTEPEGWVEGERANQMVCQVGTREFRAPELLFSPVGGYDAFAVDVWALGVTLAHFFTALTALGSYSHAIDMPCLDVEQQDERLPWQKAFESATALPSPTGSSSSSLFWEEEAPIAHHNLPRTASAYSRTPLFTPDKGDIGLAASIFHLLGLPTDVKDWPEAEHFQPPLHRLPFAATSGHGLLTAMPLFNAEPALTNLVHQVILPAITLSASKRPKASELVDALQP